MGGSEQAKKKFAQAKLKADRTVKRKKAWLDQFAGEQANRRTTLKKLYDFTVQTVAKLQRQMDEVVKGNEGVERILLERLQLYIKDEALQASLSSNNDTLTELYERAAQLKDNEKLLKADAKAAKTEAERITKEKTPRTRPGGQIDDELRLAFSTIPDTEAEIEARIQDEHVRIELNAGIQVDRSIVKQYEDREREIASLEKEIAKEESTVNDDASAIQVAKREWLDELKGHVDQVSQQFYTYMQRLDCQGEVTLSKHADEFGAGDIFEDYGI